MKIDKENMLQIAKAAALLGGKTLKAKNSGWLDRESEIGRDIKLKADRLAERIVIDALLQSHTVVPVVSEETYNEGPMPTSNGCFWVVDALDGTMNYNRGIPFCCVSIALWNQWDPLVGVVFDFEHDELFSGVVGQGAWLNESPIHVGGETEASKSVLGTGFPTLFDFSDVALKGFIDRFRSYKKIRMIGSAALSLVYVACGRLDAYHERNIMFWDVAGGLAIVKAAGGTINYSHSETIDTPLEVSACSRA